MFTCLMTLSIRNFAASLHFVASLPEGLLFLERQATKDAETSVLTKSRSFLFSDTNIFGFLEGSLLPSMGISISNFG